MNSVRETFKKLASVNGNDKRTIFGLFDGWFVASFNKIDEARLREVGPDRLAAEWILRCGGGIKWNQGGKFLRDYNSLPVGNFRTLKITAIDGKDAGITADAFSLLEKLELLEEISLDNNKYIEDDALGFLCSYTRDRLKRFSLQNTGLITDKGLHHLRVLTALESLHLAHLPGVKDPEAALSELRKHLSDCTITYPPYTDESNPSVD